jgi:hypothetical protein
MIAEGGSIPLHWVAELIAFSRISSAHHEIGR